jgi:hypothetical protein
MRVLENISYGVFCFWFLGSSSRETAKNAIKKRRWGKTTGGGDLSCLGQKLLTWTFPQKNSGVFELPLLRNAQKRH